MKQLLLLLFLALVIQFQSKAQNFIVIVNKDNQVNSITSNEVSNLFLKKTTKWENGKIVLPVDQLIDSKVRENFSKQIHKKSINSIISYWQNYIFTGSGTPPVEKENDQAVIEYVKNNIGAIGYISSNISKNDIKVLSITQ